MSALNKTVVRDYFEKVINRHNWAASDELVDNVVDQLVQACCQGWNPTDNSPPLFGLGTPIWFCVSPRWGSVDYC